MPLPSGGVWPPPTLATVQNKLAEWSAWYSGDPEALSAVYGGQRTRDTTGLFAPERGGWRAAVGRTLERWFWGTRPTSPQPRTKLHVPLASDIAVTSANLLFGEMVSITSQDTGTQQRLDELVDASGLHSTLLEAAELCAALGGVYLRVCWDADLAPHPWLSPVHADAAVPEWRMGRLVAVTFWRIVAESDRTVLRHLERHEPGLIEHGLYEGDHNELGRRIPLTEHEATAHLAGVVNAQSAIETRVPLLTAAYVPNMRPNRIWRSVPAAACLGRSDLQGIEPMLDGLDEVYSSWRRDIRLAKARLIVPRAYLHTHGRGNGASFDLEQELYEPLDILGDGTRMEISAQQFAIRVEEHQRSAADWMEQAVRGAGYSVQSFGQTGDTAMTATEVVARERRSYATRGRKIGYWRQGLGDALAALLAIDNVVFGTGVVPSRPRIEWPDGVATDPKALAETLNMLRQAEAASTETLVRMFHPDWDDVAVAEEVERITKERGTAVPDPFTLTPGDESEGEGPAEDGEEQAD